MALSEKARHNLKVAGAGAGALGLAAGIAYFATRKPASVPTGGTQPPSGGTQPSSGGSSGGPATNLPPHAHYVGSQVSGPDSSGRINLTVQLLNDGAGSGTLAAEAVTVDSSGRIVGNFYRLGNPGLAACGNDYDNPSCFQASDEAQSAQIVTLQFSTLWSGNPGTYSVVVWYGILPAGYSGPLVTGKAPGNSVQGVRPVQQTQATEVQTGDQFFIPTGALGTPTKIDVTGAGVSQVMNGQGAYAGQWTLVWLAMGLLNSGGQTGGTTLTVTLTGMSFIDRTGGNPGDVIDCGDFQAGAAVGPLVQTIQTPQLMPGQSISFTDVLRFVPGLPQGHICADVTIGKSRGYAGYRWTVQVQSSNGQGATTSFTT